MQSIFNEENIKVNPMRALHTYASELCLKEEIAVPNGVKPALCLYSGFFTLRFLAAKSKNPFKMQEMVNQFCADHLQEFTSRTSLVSELRKYYNDLSEDFLSKCVELLKVQPNPWFDPIDPTTSISVKEICDLHKKLFENLQEK
jgi:hypothetical protein